MLIDKGADVDKANNYGQTPLYFACRRGFPECARLLIDKGADVDKADDDGQTPLQMACLEGFSDCVQLLIDKGADVDKARDSGFTAARTDTPPLSPASWEIGGVSVRASGASPLIITLERGFSDCARLLINKGADVNKANNYGKTPLIICLLYTSPSPRDS